MKARRADATANAARVLAAACEIFAEQGVAAEIKDIADRAGVGVATIYRGFGSKEGLLLATAREASSRLTGLLEAAEQPDDPVYGLRSFLIDIFEFVETYGWLLQASLNSEILRKMKTRASEEVDHHARFRRLIERCVQADAFPAQPDPDVVLLLIEGVVVSLSIGRRGNAAHPSSQAIAGTLMALLTGAKTSGSAIRSSPPTDAMS